MSPSYGQGIDIFDAFINFSIAVGPQEGTSIEYYMAAFFDETFMASDYAYTRDYKPKTFTQSTDPLRFINMNAHEHLYECNRLVTRFSEFRTYKVYETTGMSFTEWMNLPTYEIDMLMNQIKNERRAQQELQDIQSRLDKHKVGTIEHSTALQDMENLHQQLFSGSMMGR